MDTRRIEELRALMCPLEAPAALRREWLQQVAEHGEVFLERLPGRKVYEPPLEDPRGILQSPFGEEGVPLEELLALVGRYVEDAGINLGSAGHLGFIPPSSLYPAALGDYLATVINRYVGVYFTAPGAVQMENMVLRWMADFVGVPAAASGDLTSGGSLANLIGVVTAREAAGLRARDYERAVVYLTEQTHHSVAKALRIAGMKECVQRQIPLDAGFHMQAAALTAAIAEDRRGGRIPWLVVGSAGTTDTGAVDPLEELGEIALRERLWLHVDGAYGAMFALCEPGRKALRGMERADSLVLDPHKGLFMPCGSGAVLVRDGGALLRAYAYDAHYLQDEGTLAKDEISPSAHSPELTRPLRGLRIWLALKLLGVQPFRAALEEKMLLARYFHARIQEVPGFEVGPRPDLSIVTFRYRPQRGDADEFNRRLTAAVQHDGRVFLSSTVIGGAHTLRVAVLSATTHKERIDVALEVLQEKARAIEEGE